MDPRHTVRAARRLVRRADFPQEISISPGSCRSGMLTPRVVPARGDSEHAAHRGNSVLGPGARSRTRRARTGPCRSPARIRPQLLPESLALRGTCAPHDAAGRVPPPPRSSDLRRAGPDRGRPAPPSSECTIPTARTRAPAPPETFRRASTRPAGAPQLRRVRRTGLRHRGLLLPNCEGADETGSTPERHRAGGSTARQLDGTRRHHIGPRRVLGIRPPTAVVGEMPPLESTRAFDNRGVACVDQRFEVWSSENLASCQDRIVRVQPGFESRPSARFRVSAVAHTPLQPHVQQRGEAQIVASPAHADPVSNPYMRDGRPSGAPQPSDSQSNLIVCRENPRGCRSDRLQARRCRARGITPCVAPRAPTICMSHVAPATASIVVALRRSPQ